MWKSCVIILNAKLHFGLKKKDFVDGTPENGKKNKIKTAPVF